VQALAEPFVTAGMIVQGDLHAPPAEGGITNLHVHLQLSLRRIEGDGFARCKAREWNRLFYRSPKILRAEIAGKLTAFCAEHGIEYDGDSRSNVERGLPVPEPTVARWNIHAQRRTGYRTDWIRERDDVRRAKKRIAELEGELAILDRDIRLEEAMEKSRRIDPMVRLLGYLEELTPVAPAHEPSRQREPLNPTYSPPKPMALCISDSEATEGVCAVTAVSASSQHAIFHIDAEIGSIFHVEPTLENSNPPKHAVLEGFPQPSM
jgi:hypothetical protein